MDAPEGEKPRVKRPLDQSKIWSKEQRQEHLAMVESLLSRGATPWEMQRAIREKTHTTLRITYLQQLSDKIRDRWQRQMDAEAASAKASQIRRMFKHLNKAIEAKDSGAIARFEDMLAKLQGTYEPLRIQAEVAQTQALRVVLATMDTGELLEELAAAQEEERQARAYQALMARGLILTAAGGEAE